MENFIEEFYRVGHGIVADLWTTRFDNIKNSMIALPTFDEQVKIANFLDEKTAQIDQAIALKQQQIEKLNELIAKYNVQIEDVTNQISEMY